MDEIHDLPGLEQALCRDLTSLGLHLILDPIAGWGYDEQRFFLVPVHQQPVVTVSEIDGGGFGRGRCGGGDRFRGGWRRGRDPSVLQPVGLDRQRRRFGGQRRGVRNDVPLLIVHHGDVLLAQDFGLVRSCPAAVQVGFERVIVVGSFCYDRPGSSGVVAVFSVSLACVQTRKVNIIIGRNTRMKNAIIY